NAGSFSHGPSQFEMVLGVLFWILLTLTTWALPVKLPRGTHQAVSLAPLVAAMALGGPAVGGWVAAIGATELRELRGRIPWYGTLANHAGIVLPAVMAGVVATGVGHTRIESDFVGAMAAAAVYVASNVGLAAGLLTIRTGQ